MIVSKVAPIDEPRRFEPHELFFSLTDDKGRIRYGNEVFTRVSGYSEDELLGKPHNVIRHPDVPRSVFKLLWDYLEAGKTIAAYVKNLAADGRYYWVLAVVTPCRDGYLSVRMKPSSALFDAARSVYADVLLHESRLEEEQGKSFAIQSSFERLVQAVRDAGFESYDEFMHAALRAEITSRAADGHNDATCGQSPSEDSGRLFDLYGALSRVKDQLAEVFESLDVFERLSARLIDKREALQELGPSLTFLALNTHVSASRMGDEGAVLSVVSRNLGEHSKDADRLISALMERLTPTCDAAKAIAFDVAVSQLEAEVSESFALELSRGESDELTTLVNESLDALIEELGQRCDSLLAALHALLEDTGGMTRVVREIVSQVEQMKTAQLNGKIDIASRRSAESFQTIFEDVARIVADARRDCEEVIEVLVATTERLSTLVTLEPTLRVDLAQMASSTKDIVAPCSGVGEFS